VGTSSTKREDSLTAVIQETVHGEKKERRVDGCSNSSRKEEDGVGKVSALVTALEKEGVAANRKQSRHTPAPLKR